MDLPSLFRLPLDGEGGPLAVDEVISLPHLHPSSAPSGHLPHEGEGLGYYMARTPHPPLRGTFPTRGKACNVCDFYYT